MSGNSGAWGIAMWKDGRGDFETPPQDQGISLEGGDAIVPFLPTAPLGCLTQPPEGMGVPSVRSGDVAFAQRDGVVQFGDYYEPRILTFQVSICNDGCPGCPTGRAKAKRLTTEWSRNCSGATLVIFSDCHDPDATEEEKTITGPYLVHGRPRVADITWLPSDVGCADVVLRFDAEDARLRLAMTPDDGTPWSSEHTADADTNENIAPDYRLDGLTMTTNGATVNDAHLSSGAPDGGSYFSRIMVTANTSSPMTMALSGTGTSAIPVTAGLSYTTSWYARKSPGGGPVTRADWTWYTAAGAVVSSTTGTTFNPTSTWARFSQTNVAPPTAAFGQPRLAWSTPFALVGQELDFAQGWVNEGAVATAPEILEVVGDLCAFPVIRLFGTLTAPITVNYGSAQFVYNEDVTDTVVVDTRWGRASTSTVDTTQHLSGNYTQPLNPGLNDFSMTSSSPADTGSARAEWSNSVVSG